MNKWCVLYQILVFFPEAESICKYFQVNIIFLIKYDATKIMKSKILFKKHTKTHVKYQIKKRNWTTI